MQGYEFTNYNIYMPTFCRTNFVPAHKKSPDSMRLHKNQGYESKGNFRLDLKPAVGQHEGSVVRDEGDRGIGGLPLEEAAKEDRDLAHRLQQLADRVSSVKS